MKHEQYDNLYYAVLEEFRPKTAEVLSEESRNKR
jgi:hypothetical protein